MCKDYLENFQAAPAAYWDIFAKTGSGVEGERAELTDCLPQLRDP
jgi:hypothetical protein